MASSPMRIKHAAAEYDIRKCLYTSAMFLRITMTPPPTVSSSMLVPTATPVKATAMAKSAKATSLWIFWLSLELVEEEDSVCVVGLWEIMEAPSRRIVSSFKFGSVAFFATGTVLSAADVVDVAGAVIISFSVFGCVERNWWQWSSSCATVPVLTIYVIETMPGVFNNRVRVCYFFWGGLLLTLLDLPRRWTGNPQDRSASVLG